MSGRMVPLSLIASLVSLLQVLGSLLTSLRTAGVVVGGVMLTVFVQVVKFRLVGVSVLFLGLSSLFRELRCWVSFWLCSLLVRYTLVVDNLGVVRHVGRLLDGHCGSAPFEPVNDGDLFLLIERMLHLRGLDTVRITKVKGHADQSMVLDGRVREIDRLGNDAADEAADFGRRLVSNAVIDARRNLSGVCGRWYPVILDIHRFFIAISRAVVNHGAGDGTAPDPLVWSAGASPGGVGWFTRFGTGHSCPGHLVFGARNGLMCLPASDISAEDIAQWPYTTGLLVKWVSFCGSLHWPAGGVGGVSYVILYELWAGERLSFEKAHPRYLRPGRPISVSAVPFGPGIDIWHSCRFIGALMRSLCLLPGGLRRFVPCSIGANHWRLLHIGWEKCGHGLTSRPRESASDCYPVLVQGSGEHGAISSLPVGMGQAAAAFAGTLRSRPGKLDALGSVRSREGKIQFFLKDYDGHTRVIRCHDYDLIRDVVGYYMVTFWTSLILSRVWVSLIMTQFVCIADFVVGRITLTFPGSDSCNAVLAGATKLLQVWSASSR